MSPGSPQSAPPRIVFAERGVDRLLDRRVPRLPAARVIAALGLAPHPGGGHDQETWHDGPADGGRGAGPAIFDLLAAGERSHWHRIDAAEISLWQAGASLPLGIAAEGRMAEGVRFGPDRAASGRLQAAMLPGLRRAARTLGAWVLVTGMVAPGGGR
jgi:uncharacterized protein